MARIKFKNGCQKEFLNKIQHRARLKNHSIAEICGISERTFRDWKKGKYLISYKSLLKLCRMGGTVVPKKAEILPEFWSVVKAGKLGGKKRFELYGSPGTLESRRKGGIISSQETFGQPGMG